MSQKRTDQKHYHEKSYQSSKLVVEISHSFVALFSSSTEEEWSS